MAYDAAMTRAQAHITRLIGNGWTVAAVSRAAKCSRSTLYRALSGDDITLTKIKAILAVRGYPPARKEWR
jgi:lambda repressor-like predicted transcriptional regulator